MPKKAIENYKKVASGSYLDKEFVIRELNVDDKISFYGKKCYHFNKTGKCEKEHTSFYIEDNEFDHYVTVTGYNNYTVCMCVNSFYDDPINEARTLFNSFLSLKNKIESLLENYRYDALVETISFSKETLTPKAITITFDCKTYTLTESDLDAIRQIVSNAIGDVDIFFSCL